MTFDRRLAKIDETLTPTQLVLRWLAEAHAHESLEAYVRSILDAPGDQQPIDRLCREAHDGAQARLRGKPAEQVRAAVRSALRETVFRFELVMRIYVTTHELLDREFPIHALFAMHLAMLASEDRREPLERDWHGRRLDQCRSLTLFRVDELLAAREARTTVETRYLDGHPALFPDVAAAFEKQLKSSKEVAATAVRLAELDGLPPASPADPDALSRRTAELVADLVEPAKSTALEKLGDGERALDIAVRWLRPKLVPAPIPVPDTPSR